MKSFLEPRWDRAENFMQLKSAIEAMRHPNWGHIIEGSRRGYRYPKKLTRTPDIMP